MRKVGVPKMEDAKPTINTTFWLEGDRLDLDFFTTEIGIQPTYTMKKGWLSSNPTLRESGHKNPSTMWEINHKFQSYSMDEGVQKVLSIIWEKRDQILDYVRDSADVEVGIRSAIWIYEDRPVYDLSADTIQRLAYLECNFCIDDVYDMRNADDDEEWFMSFSYRKNGKHFIESSRGWCKWA